MLSANQMAGILNKLFAEQNDETASFSKLTKTHKNFLVGDGQKWVWPIWPLDCKIDCISRINQ